MTTRLQKSGPWVTGRVLLLFLSEFGRSVHALGSVKYAHEYRGDQDQ